MDLYTDLTGTDTSNDDDTIGHRYESAIAAYQLACGGGLWDMSPSAFGRFRALEVAGGDADLARRLWFARWLYRQGRIRL